MNTGLDTEKSGVLESDETCTVSRGSAGITRRSVLVGFCLAALLCAVTPYNDYVIHSTFVGGNHFPLAAFALLLLLSVINLGIYRISGRTLFHARELGVIYIITLTTAGIPGSGLVRYLLGMTASAYYFRLVGSQLESVIWSHIPTWLAVSEGTSRGFWEGAAVSVPWREWWFVLSRWFILVAAIWTTMICLASLVRKQWADRERLTFPLIQLPLEVLKEDRGPGTAFFGSRLMWMGTAIIFLLHLINGLHQHYPALPAIPIAFRLDSYFPDRPWIGLNPLRLQVMPSVIGFGYLMPLEVTAGFWGSVLFMKVQAIVLSACGFEGYVWEGDILNITRQEEMGGLLLLAAILFWSLRGTFAEAGRSLFRHSGSSENDTREALSYRMALLGLIVSLVVALIWLVQAGMTWPVAALDLFFFLCICLVLTRIVAEAGLMHVQISAFGPSQYLLMLAGAPALGPGNFTVLAFVEVALLGRDPREAPMPAMLNSFRLAELSGISKRRLVPTIIAAMALCLVISTLSFLFIMYKYGAAQVQDNYDLWLPAHDGIYTLATRLQSLEAPSAEQFLLSLVGAAIVGVLAWLRITFVWWPFHPLGFVMATSWPMTVMWSSLLVAWLLKLLTLRYLGLSGYIKARSFFFGLIVGDTLGAILWMIVGFFTGTGILTSGYI